MVEEEKSSGSRVSSWTRDSLFVVILMISVGGLLIFFQFENTYLVYLKEFYGLIELRIGFLYAFNTVLIIVFEMVLIHRVERYPKLRVIGLGFLLICLGFGLVPFGTTFAFAAFAMVIVTIGEMLAIPLLGAWVGDRSTVQNRGAYMGAYSAAFGVSIMGAPLIGMHLYAVNPHWLWYGALVLGAILFVGFWNASKRDQAPDRLS